MTAETATQRRADWRPTACILCECNCGILVKLGGEDGRRFEQIRGDKAHPASKGYTCAWGPEARGKVLGIGGWSRSVRERGFMSPTPSPEHRDDPGQGCPLAALLPELARQPLETRRVYADNFLALARKLASALPAKTADPEAVAMAIYATLIGSIQLARAAEGTDLSDRILAAGRDAVRALAQGDSSRGASTQ
jgi:hypothetical protein